MPDVVQDESGNFLIDSNMVFEGMHKIAALVDGVPLKKFNDGDPTFYIAIDDAIAWWEKADAKDGPLEDLLALKGKIERGEFNLI